MSSKRIKLYKTAPQPCPYLPGKQEEAIITEPNRPIGTLDYGVLINQGFRRAGSMVYRPSCRGCTECVSVRVVVDAFRPRRGQKRVMQRNEDLVWRLEPLAFNAEHWSLYQRYQRARHPGGGMDRFSEEDYVRFILESDVDSMLITGYLNGKAVAVALTDFLASGLSAVYTFYDPDLSRRALGVAGVLQQIAFTRKWQRPYLYLGYWVADSEKMAYKTNYQPLEGWIDEHWTLLAQ